jgi:ABC-2 type transport system ATP-binding protein
MGQAMVFGLGSVAPNEDKTKLANSLIAGIGGTTIISSAFTIIPITIVDFKNSVLMKRMGATNIQPFHFILIIIGLFIVQSTFTFFYTRLVATIIFGHQLG